MATRLWLALGAAAWTAPALAPVVPAVAAALGLARRTESTATVALTFDDGPHPQGTPAMLEILAAREARATFFVVGEQAERFPAVCGEVLAAGHELAIHGYRHRNQLRLTPRQLAEDLERATATIGAFTGMAPEIYRPPYGIFSAAGLPIVRSRGLRPVLWSRWGHDWRRRIAPTAIAAEATVGLGGGDVILLHDADHYSATDSWRRTAAALPLICDRIEALGLRTAAVQG
jgi:peptidoglycan/xylan/chitin deacetylase (PgdA/CDA1 family)